MHLQFTDIKITIKTGLSHKGIDKGDVTGLVDSRGKGDRGKPEGGGGGLRSAKS